MDEQVGYMNSGSAINTDDLGPAPIKTIWSAMGEPRACRVCGKERPGFAMTPMRSYRDPETRPHAACDRQITAWEKRAATVDQDPDYLAAVERAVAAQAEADQAWEAKVRTLGLPDWIVESVIASHQQGWHD